MLFGRRAGNGGNALLAPLYLCFRATPQGLAGSWTLVLLFCGVQMVLGMASLDSRVVWGSALAR